MTAVLVCKADDVQVGTAVKVTIDDVPIALVKDSAGTLHALGDTCSHGEISLSEGFVEDDTLECWAHPQRIQNGSVDDVPHGEEQTRSNSDHARCDDVSYSPGFRGGD